MTSNLPSTHSEVASLDTTIATDLEKHTMKPVDKESSETASMKSDLEKQTPKAIEPASDAQDLGDERQYPPKNETMLVMISLYFTMFLMALVSAVQAKAIPKLGSSLIPMQDRTIIATAIPYITDDFHSFGDVGWYGSAYMLTMAAFMLLIGRVYTFYSPKWVFFGIIVIFEIGSVICGAAPTSKAFIVGRAISGFGAAGMMNGAIVIMVNVIPLAKRPVYQGIFGSVFAIASVAGPLLGGAFTQKVSWRWCFYINLPIGAVTLAIVALVLKLPEQKTQKSLKEQFMQLDPIGTAFFLPGVICLLLALQWGGSTYAWNNGRIIALLVIFGVCLCAFVTVQVWLGDMVTVPPRIIKQRSIAAAVWFSLCVGGLMLAVVYFLPIWFQVIKDATPVHSGIMNLPTLLSLVVASMLSGIFVKKVGYYTPPLIACSVIMPIGLGLFTTFTPETGHAKWIGYQVIFGLGLGLGMQQASMAAQTVLPNKDVPTGVSLNFFAQQVGGTVFVSVGENVLVNKLVSGLADIPNFDPGAVVNTGATEIKSVVPPQFLGVVKAVYNHALTEVFVVALVLSCLTIFGALAIEWRNIKAQKDR